MSFSSLADLIDRQLEDEVARDPLEALRAVGDARRVLEGRQRQAVRAAVQGHSWAEIGEAMGVSRQAAHHRFAREWAEELKGEIKAANAVLRSAARAGDDDRAGAAKAEQVRLISEFRRVARSQK